MNNFIVPARGSDTVGLVRYLFGPGSSREHTDQRVIAADMTLGLEAGLRLDHEVDAGRIFQIGKEMDSHRVALGVQVPKGFVWHCAISLPPEESTPENRLTDEQWAKVAHAAVERLGFTEGPGRAACRWIAVHHGLSVNGNDHLHLAVNLVREDGSVATTWNDRVKMSKLCAELEAEFGLYVVEGRAGRGMPGYSQAEHQRSKASGQAPDRVRIARTVRACATSSATEAEFVRRLKTAGLHANPRYTKGGTEVVGYSVRVGDDGDTGVWFGGGRLAADLTLPRLREHWPASSTDGGLDDALAEWKRSYDTPGPRGPQETAQFRQDSWQQAADRLDEICEQMEATPHGDTAAWATASRGAAGLFAIFSDRIEERPGAMAAAADTLARSAQTRADQARLMVDRQALKAFRGIALTIGQGALPAERQAERWLILLRSLLRLLKAIEDLNQATRQLHQAAALAAEHQRLATYVDSLTRITAAELRSPTAAPNPFLIAGLDFPGRRPDLSKRPAPSTPPPRPRQDPGRSPGLGR